ncbi:MAG TPA: hypothetical protein VJZ92_04375 [Thermodesulfobacteriota bacterium]|nr:hypothetical protein [Thermodesulfobacteriota bacterium]
MRPQTQKTVVFRQAPLPTFLDRKIAAIVLIMDVIAIVEEK